MPECGIAVSFALCRAYVRTDKPAKCAAEQQAFRSAIEPSVVSTIGTTKQRAIGKPIESAFWQSNGTAKQHTNCWSDLSAHN